MNIAMVINTGTDDSLLNIQPVFSGSYNYGLCCPISGSINFILPRPEYQSRVNFKLTGKKEISLTFETDAIGRLAVLLTLSFNSLQSLSSLRLKSLLFFSFQPCIVFFLSFCGYVRFVQFMGLLRTD